MEESRRAALAREAGAWLEPLLEESGLKFPPELSGGRPQRVGSSDRSLTVTREGLIAAWRPSAQSGSRRGSTRVVPREEHPAP